MRAQPGSAVWMATGPAEPADHQAGTLRARFPPRPVAGAWPQTLLPRQAVQQRLAAAPFVAGTAAGEDHPMVTSTLSEIGGFSGA